MKRSTRNKYAGPCRACGELMPPEEGFVVRDEGLGRWLVFHRAEDPKCGVRSDGIRSCIRSPIRSDAFTGPV